MHEKITNRRVFYTVLLISLLINTGTGGNIAFNLRLVRVRMAMILQRVHCPLSS